MALVESDLPGGHSPAYFAVLNQPLPTTPLTWRNDPASFDSFPEFFLAHEVAHQWWGQAVGWRNYHEQWLSEGFAQYFAALYAQHQRGDECSRRAAADAHVGHRRVGPGAGLPRLPPRAHPRATAASSARSSTTRAPSCCTCCGGSSATTRSSAGCRRFYRDVAVHEGRHRRSPRGDGSSERPARSSGSSTAGSTARRCRA